MSSIESREEVSTVLPPLMSIDRTRAAGGGRGRGWVYERIATGDFETILDGSRRLIVTESFLKWLDSKRNESISLRKHEDEVPGR